MRISDWSSDVCSSDLFRALFHARAPLERGLNLRILSEQNVGMPATGRNLPLRPSTPFASSEVEIPLGLGVTSMGVSTSLDTNGKIGRASCRERVCPSV